MRKRLASTLVLALASLAGARLCDAASANVAITFPPDNIKQVIDDSSIPSVHKADWNAPGNRCQFNCDSTVGPSDVGLSAVARAFVQAGSAPPTLEIFNDGRIKARTTALVGSQDPNASDANYDVYLFSASTRCSTRTICSATGNNCTSNADCPGFPNFCVFKFCNHDTECRDATHATDACLVCGSEGCSDTVSSLCPSTCQGGDNDGKECNCTGCAVCSGGGVCTQTCRLLKNCGKPPTGLTTCLSGLQPVDCTGNGAPIVMNETGTITTGVQKIGTAPLHFVFGQAIGTPFGGTTRGVLGSSANVYRVGFGNSSSPFTTCSTNCNGTPLRTGSGTVPNCS